MRNRGRLSLFVWSRHETRALGIRALSSRPGSPRGERGQSFVEFAVVLPVLALMVGGIFKGGVLYNDYLRLTDALRSGGRELATQRGQATPCANAAQVLINAAAGLNGSIKITITESGDPHTYTSIGLSGSGICPTLKLGSSATIKAQYPCNLSIMGINFVPGCTLTASATEKVE
jgi:TadE-like protein